MRVGRGLTGEEALWAVARALSEVINVHGTQRALAGMGQVHDAASLGSGLISPSKERHHCFQTTHHLICTYAKEPSHNTNHQAINVQHFSETLHCLLLNYLQCH